MTTKLDLRDQNNLPLLKQVAIAVDGIQYRLFRSLLTLGVVVLAVAFLSNVLVEHQIADACKTGVGALASEQRELGQVAVFFDTEMPPRELARNLAELPPGSWLPQSLTAWMGVDKERLPLFMDDCASLLQYDAWFDELPPGHQRILTEGLDRETLFAQLQDPDERREFVRTARMIPLRLPDGLVDFLPRRSYFLESLRRASDHFNKNREAFASHIEADGLAEWLAATDVETAADLFDAHQVSVPSERLEALMVRAGDRQRERDLLRVLREPRLATAWRDEFGEVFDQRRALVALAEHDERALWMEERELAQAADIDAGIAVDAARRILQTRRILDMDELLIANYGTRTGLDANMFWLLVVSFMVCIAGITNAMLISVIERFREIATMKCLGALNGFIARLSLIEAAAMGLVGGFLGVLLGGVIAVTRMAYAYGHWVWRFFPWSDLGWGALIAIASGLALATLSALYPAFAAARMVPVDAMRVE